MERRSMKRGCLWLTILLSAVGCGSSDLLGPEAHQGIEGLVLLGPQCPVQTEDDPCPDLPYQAWIRVRHADGGIITRIRSDEDGRFRVGLRPGKYILDPESGDPFPHASREEAEVERDRYTEIVLFFDTGIR